MPRRYLFVMTCVEVRGQSARVWFSPSITWVLEINLRLGSKDLPQLRHLAGP